MKDKINIAELLKDCPKGMELDCTIFNGKVYFEGIDDNNSAYPIKISVNLVNIEHLDIYGQYNTRDYTKCVIFPKGKTTWEGFVPPYKYPKTYEECCDVLKIEYPYFKTEKDGISASTYKNKLFGALKQLLICRDAYWKIAGEQMGLGKPWEPNWRNSDEDKYCIEYSYGRINSVTTNIYNYILAFPTAEMRDAFKENFWVLIELCKELL